MCYLLRLPVPRFLPAMRCWIFRFKAQRKLPTVYAKPLHQQDREQFCSQISVLYY